MFLMRKLVKFLCIIVLLAFAKLAWPQSTDAVTVAEPTMIQLKTMQERKFLKPYEDLLDAIKTAVGYSSGECQLIREPTINTRGRQIKGQMSCRYRPIVPEVKASNPLLGFIPFVGPFAQMAEIAQNASDMQKVAEEARKQITKIDFELSFPKKKDSGYKDDETIVKMVMFQGVRNPAVVKIAEIYAENFKKLGDALFIEALEISPAEQE